MNNDNINNPAYKNIIKNFNIVIGIAFILLVSAIYVTYIFNINIPQLNSNTDLAALEGITVKSFLYNIRIFFSFLIPLSSFIFLFLFVLNPISVKSILISFVLIFLMTFYLYKLPYDVLINPFDNLYAFISLIINLISANLIILFIVGLSFIRYDIRKYYALYDFYTMITEIIIWSFLILFIISLIVFSITALLYLNDKIDAKRILRFLIRNDMKNLKIFLSIFAILNTFIIYFSYLLYNKMINTKLSISVSRVIIPFISVSSIVIIILTFKSNIINNNYFRFLFLLYILFMIFFILNIFLFRIDKEHKKIEYYIYIISNILGIIFSIFLLYIYFNKFSYHYFIIFNLIVIINFLYNIFVSIMKKYIKFVFLYNFLYMIFFIILLFVDFI
ncbi:O-antigen polymerase [Brachyspira intermedia]|uniref:O-antigen polymerase n=1 Tax=Brachyspira intermedia TaxID=84377 RepID=UPI003007414B